MRNPGEDSPRTDETGAAPIPELDGVRGLAILLVLLFHFQGVRPPWIPKALTYPMMLGWSGVDLFFVLSGFLITRILLETRGASNYFAAFYARRVLRIFPLYLVAVFLCFRVALPLASRFGLDLESDRTLEPWFWFHVSNWRSAFGRDVKPLSHFWSLSIEEQFYLVWPVVVLWTKPRRLPAVCSALVVLACGARCLAADRGVAAEALHRLTVFRLDALTMGGLVAALVRVPAWRQRLHRWLRSIFLGVLVLLIPLLVSGRGATSPAMIRLGYTAFALLYACLVFAAYDAAGSSRGFAAFLRRPSLRAFGKYSYALYVFHYPISVVLGRAVAERSRDASDAARTGLWLGALALGILASFLLALASWNLLEKRFLALKRWFLARPAEVPA